MRTIVKVALGTFARAGIEAHLGSDVLTGLRVALVDYARKLESGSSPIEIPRFCRGAVPAAVDFELPVDRPTLAILEREAERQGASVSQLAAHAVLACLAELDRMTPASGPAV
jgi:hypothetical protein